MPPGEPEEAEPAGKEGAGEDKPAGRRMGERRAIATIGHASDTPDVAGVGSVSGETSFHRLGGRRPDRPQTESHPARATVLCDARRDHDV